nr:hypothetical protein [Albidovulum inexpectatum]
MPVDVPNAVAVRIIPVVDVAEYRPTGVVLVCDDRHRPVELHRLDCLVEKGLTALASRRAI